MLFNSLHNSCGCPHHLPGYGLVSIPAQMIHYSPATGVFTWLISPNRNIKAGTTAGCLDKPKGYLRIMVDGTLYQAHRLAFLAVTGKLPKDQLDHINHVRGDNRWDNLREATNQENSKNRALSKTNSSGVCGVCWNKNAKKWNAQIWVNYKKIHLGYFDDINDAIISREKANIKYSYHQNHGK